MADLHEGDRVGDYVLERPLGKGSFGRVWLARHVLTNEAVAFKLLAANSAAGSQTAARLDLERLAVAAARDSEHVVKVKASGQEPAPYLLMEYVDGTDLKDVPKPLPQEEVIEIGLAVADALRALHRVRIIHCDVKPANILRERHGHVKLCDFGIAKILGYEETVALEDNTPLSAPYAAPEVWEKAATHQSDIYALGVVLYELLTGKTPFEGGVIEQYRYHLLREPDLSMLPEQTAPSLRELIYLCLRKSIGERPANAEACIELLEQAQGELRKEPVRFGPWLKEQPHPKRAWAWYCRHEQTDQVATVEVHFAQDEQLGEALRQAVVASRELAPLGAERLLGTNRLLLADDEGWPNPPPHNLVFWLAREDPEVERFEGDLDEAALGKATSDISALIDAATARGLKLRVDGTTAMVRADGSVFLRRPGLPPPPEVDARFAALHFLRGLPLTEKAALAVNSATSLRELEASLSGPPVEIGAMDGPVRGRGRRLNLGLASVAAAGVAIATLGAAVAITGAFPPWRGGSNSPQKTPEAAVTAEPTMPPPDADACSGLKLPTPIAEASAICGPVGLTTIESADDCPRGQVCRVERRGDGFVLAANDLALAFIDDGNLMLARGDGKPPAMLLSRGDLIQAAWSPDGRYLALLSVTGGNGDNPGSQLRVVEAGRTANQGIVVSLPGGGQPPEWYGGRVASIGWAADGASIYFLWTGNGADGIYRINLTQGPNGLDFGKIRSDLAAGEVLTDNVFRVSLEPSAQLAAGSFAVHSGGVIAYQVCGSQTVCGLGRWDGASGRIVLPPAAGTLFLPQAWLDQEVVAIRIGQRGDGRIVAVASNGTVREGHVLAASDLGPGPDQASLTLLPDGESGVLATATGRLKLMPLFGEGESDLGPGRAPDWFVPSKATSVPGPPATKFATPTPTPTPSPTATPAIPTTGVVDLSGTLAGGSCSLRSELVVSVKNLGPGSLAAQDIFITVQGLDGSVKVPNNPKPFPGLAAGQSFEVHTGYRVQEPVVVIIDSIGKLNLRNNRVECRP